MMTAEIKPLIETAQLTELTVAMATNIIQVRLGSLPLLVLLFQLLSVS